MKVLILGLIGFFSLGCQRSNGSDKSAQVEDIGINDTLVGSEMLTDEISGMALRKRATAYFLILGHDTSEFKPIFIESKNDNIYLLLNLSSKNNTTTHQQRMNELAYILSKASKDYNFEYFKQISLGRLIKTGDLAVSITDQLIKKYRKDVEINPKEYQLISRLLMRSQAMSDFNEVLAPYSLSVSKFSIEKTSLIPKEYLYNYSKIKTDPEKLPKQILDGIAVITLKRTT